MSYLINNKDQMRKFAEEIASKAKVGDVFGLNGTLGAGKTFFASAFINSLNQNKTEVTSPTFNIVFEYNSIKGKIFHFDLYRIKDSDELMNIGITEYILDGISLIEWPDIGKDFYNKNYKEIQFDIIDENKRLINIKCVE